MIFIIICLPVLLICSWSDKEGVQIYYELQTSVKVQDSKSTDCWPAVENYTQAGLRLGVKKTKPKKTHILLGFEFSLERE